MKKIAALICAFFVLLIAPASAIDRITWSAGLQPPSQWLLQESRFVRVGFGAFLQQEFGAANLPAYSNLTVSPVASTLTVQIAPSTAGTIGSIYIQGTSDVNPWGSSPVGGLGNLALSTDATLIALQANITATSTVPGTVSVPGTTGQSQVTIVECNITTVDQNLQSANFSDVLGILSQRTVTRDRVDLPACILKPGAAAATGSQVTPAADANYVSVATVTVPFATTAVTAGMIASVTATQFLGFARIGTGGGGVTSVTATGNLASSGGVTPNIAISNSPTFTGAVTASGLGIRYTGFGDASVGTDTAGGVNFLVAPVAPTYGYRFFANSAGTLNNLLSINTTGITASVPITTTGSISTTGGNISATGTVSGATVNSSGAITANGVSSGVNFTFSASANAELNNDGTTVYLHAIGSAGNGISFVNGPNSAYAPIFAGAYTNASDRRLKRNITPYTHGLDTILSLKPVHFVWREDSKKSMGFIAQDVLKVLPELVSSNKLSGKPTLSVNYVAMIAPLAAAVQEQQREIIELRAELKAMQSAQKPNHAVRRKV